VYPDSFQSYLAFSPANSQLVCRGGSKIQLTGAVTTQNGARRATVGHGHNNTLSVNRFDGQTLAERNTRVRCTEGSFF
jgi:hypothetical protein